MTTESKPLGLQIQDEILERLAASHPEALTTAQLYDAIGIAPESLHISRALYQLRHAGRVDLGDPAIIPKKGPQNTYRLTDAERIARGQWCAVIEAADAAQDADASRLLAHLEQELAPADAEPSAPAAVQSALDSEHWDTAAQSHNGDECDLAARQTAAYQAVLQDPVIRAIHRMPELPRIQEARMHADRLAAVVGRLDAGMPILPDPDVIAWLRDQHDFFMEHAA